MIENCEILEKSENLDDFGGLKFNINRGYKRISDGDEKFKNEKSGQKEV